jgi:ribonuclease R
MVRDGQLLQNRTRRLRARRTHGPDPGVVIANPDGFGFLRPEKGGGDDLFLPPFEMRKVMHGDRVLASVTGMDRRGRREGAIVEVLERRLTALIGRYTMEAGIGYVVPDDRRIQRNVLIPPGESGDAKTGQLVVAKSCRRPTRSARRSARCSRCSATSSRASLAVEAAIHGTRSRTNSRRSARRSHRGAADVEPESMIAGRVDLRKLPLVTIDGEDAKDFDDAVYCEPTREGFRLVVAIADVSHYVRPARRSTTKRSCARRRCTSPASSCRCCRRRCPTASAR